MLFAWDVKNNYLGWYFYSGLGKKEILKISSFKYVGAKLDVFILMALFLSE